MRKYIRFGSPILHILTAALLAVSCLGQSTPSKPIYYYTLDYPAPPLSFDQQLPCILRVQRFSVSPPYKSQRIVYADKGLHRNAYTYHQWIATPGDLLPFLLARDLRHSGGFQTVLVPDAALNATHTVNGWIEHFLEKDQGSGCQADLSLHITIVSDLEPEPDKRIVFKNSYRMTADCPSQTPEGMAQAMSSVLEQLSPILIKDIYQGLNKAPSKK
jgi:ABC-type uncharacterized transport system auxiliary subunit